jgi:hypothetical protein
MATASFGLDSHAEWNRAEAFSSLHARDQFVYRGNVCRGWIMARVFGHSNLSVYRLLQFLDSLDPCRCFVRNRLRCLAHKAGSSHWKGFLSKRVRPITNVLSSDRRFATTGIQPVGGTKSACPNKVNLVLSKPPDSRCS